MLVKICELQRGEKHIMQKKNNQLNLIEILIGKKTTLVCSVDNSIADKGTIMITNSNGKTYNGKYYKSLPQNCFSTSNIMYITTDCDSVTLSDKVTCS